MDAEQPKPGLSILFAREAPIGVVLVGAEHKVQMVKWDERKDKFEFGQWLSSVIVSADLSPDGRYIVCDVGGSKSRDVRYWTALSRPPYFTALAFFEHGVHSCGSYFRSNADVVIAAAGADMQKRITLGGPFEFHEPSPDQDNPNPNSFYARCHREPGSIQAGRYILTIHDHYRTNIDISDGEKKLWRADREMYGFEVDSLGRVAFVKQGKLFVIDTRKAPLPEPKLIADFNGSKFQNITPPAWATRWA